MDTIDNSVPLARRALRYALSWVYLIAMLGAVCFVVVLAAAYFLKIYAYGRFSNGPENMVVMVGETFGQTYGYVDAIARDNNPAVALEAKQWDTLVGIWKRARLGPRSTSWRTAGELREIDGDSARLFVLSGPGIRFVVREDMDCVAFDLPPAQWNDFERALLRVQAHFAGRPTVAALQTNGQVSLAAATEVLTHWPPSPPDVPDCKRGA